MNQKFQYKIGNIFWQTSVNNQIPKLRVHINNIVIEVLLDTGADITITGETSTEIRLALRRESE